MSDKPLWSDAKIMKFPTTIDKHPSTQAMIRRALLEMRRDYEAALAERDRRIAELEAAADPEALAIVYGKGYADAEEKARKRMLAAETECIEHKDTISHLVNNHNQLADEVRQKDARIVELEQQLAALKARHRAMAQEFSQRERYYLLEIETLQEQQEANDGKRT